MPVTHHGNPGTVRTLAQPGITGIDLRADTTYIELPDGSMITGQTTFIMGGVTRTAANVALVAEAMGALVVDAVSTSGGTGTATSTSHGQHGERLFVVTSVTAPAIGKVTNFRDTNDDGVFEWAHRITKVLGKGQRDKI